jgi:hypothetical protein
MSRLSGNFTISVSTQGSQKARLRRGFLGKRRSSTARKDFFNKKAPLELAYSEQKRIQLFSSMCVSALAENFARTI